MKKKKTNRNTAKPLVSTYDISFIRYVTKKFLRCSRAKELQINVKKVCCTCKVVIFVVIVFFSFLLIKPIDFFAVLVAVAVKH